MLDCNGDDMDTGRYSNNLVSFFKQKTYIPHDRTGRYYRTLNPEISGGPEIKRFGKSKGEIFSWEKSKGTQ